MKKIEELSEEQLKRIEAYGTMMDFASMKKSIVNDIEGNQSNSVIYQRYPKEKFIRYLKTPQKNEKEIRRLSGFLYNVSSHYRRLCDYISEILYYNYTIIPTNIDPIAMNGKAKKKYKEVYYQVINQVDKYNLKTIIPDILKVVVKEGVFFGLTYESKDSFYIQNFNPDYAKIYAIEGGSFLFKIDLTYFNGRTNLLDGFDKEIRTAYEKYKGYVDENGNKIKGNKKMRWFAPSKGICIKLDKTDQVHSLPLFLGLIASIYDIEDYKMLQKAKAENENYKALSMKMDTDDDGVPRMDEGIARKYYLQASNNVPDGIGLILSPFEIKEHTFSDSPTSNTTAVIDAENEFWFASGVSPLIFGSTKATSSNSLTLSVKPDEQIAYSLLKQIELFFNNKIKKMNFDFGFKIDFSNQSIFNSSEITEKYFKAATYGVAGAKLKYAQALGLSPSEMIGMSYLEDEVLEVGKKMFTRPLISSNTLSGGQVNTNTKTTGRPSNDSKGEPLTESGENSRETRD